MPNFLVQMLLPLYDNGGARFPPRMYRQVQQELVAAFGGVTAYARAPATGLWREDGEDTVRDDLVVLEVMTDNLDDTWWRAYRAELERRFAQDALVVRAQEIRML